MAQKDTNPYPYSDSNKRYLTYDRYMKLRFGGKAAKLPLDIGCTCPNIDGRCGHGGCIYCLNGSASASSVGTLEEQLEAGRAVAERKWKPVGFIPYFQSNSNTYGDTEKLRRIFLKAAEYKDALMLDIATRADCLDDDILNVLAEVAEIIPLTVELGLQTSDDRTAAFINRGHTFAEFKSGYSRLTALADTVNAAYPAEPKCGIPMKRFTTAVHIINGLPGETHDDMLKTASDTASLMPDMVKIHALHVLKGTVLERMYDNGKYIPMNEENYVNTVCDELEILPPCTVLGRISGDAPDSVFISPDWCRRKTAVSNDIDKEMYRRNSFQGLKYKDKP